MGDAVRDGGSHPEFCSGFVNVDRATFVLLKRMIEKEQLKGLRFHTTGIGYGWEPDGSTNQWDVANHNNASIESVEIATALLAKPAEPSLLDQIVDAMTPSAPTQPNEELTAIRGVSGEIAKTNARLGWVIALLVATIAVVLLK